MALTKDYAFESERLRYRGINELDAEQIVIWRSNPENYRNFLDPKPITIEEHLAWFTHYMDDSTRYDFLIVDGEGNSVGTCGLSNIGGASCEISYMIGSIAARGKGYATEAVRALTEVAFRELGVTYVDARILAHNTASIHVVEKCGFGEKERVYRCTP